MNYEFYVEETGQRLDIYLAENVKDRSRSFFKKLIREDKVLVNNENQKAGYILQEGDLIRLSISEEKPLEIEAENIPLDILYEDKDLAIINKPIDLVVHPGDKNLDGTLVNGLLYHFKSLSDRGDRIRPGIVHRLDKDTSGLIVIAKNNYSYDFLVDKFKKRDIKREYILIVRGYLDYERGTIDEPIGRDEKNRTKMVVNYKNGRPAITHYRVIERLNKFTLVEARLETGRTHQIRAHFSHINHPVLGDKVYFPGKMPFNIDHQLLHCIRIGFVHPSSGKYMEFESEIPHRFKEAIEKINNK